MNSVMHLALFCSDLPHLEFHCFQSICANRDVVAELHLHLKMEKYRNARRQRARQRRKSSVRSGCSSAGAPHRPWGEESREEKVTKGKRAITSSRPNAMCCKTSKKPRTKAENDWPDVESMSCPAVGAPRVFTCCTPVVGKG